MTARYAADGKNMFYAIPFAFSDANQVGARLCLSDGRERVLKEGVDYRIAGSYLAAILPPSSTLIIWQKENPARAAAGVATLADAAPVYQGEEAPSGNAAAAQEALAQAEGRLASIRLTLDAMIADCLSDMEKRLLAAQSLILEDFNRKAGRSARTLAAGLEMEAAVRPARRRRSLEGIASGERIDLGMAYYAGTSTLTVYCDGQLLAPNVDYDEIGKGVALSIIALRDFAPSEWDFITAPANIPRKIGEEVRVASAARHDAVEAAARAQTASEQAQGGAESADLARRWADVSEKAAREAYRAECRAYESAWAASVSHRRPGVACLKDISQLRAPAHGSFIVNPHITHAPSVFMGVYGASSISDMSFEGVFFIGEPYGPNPVLPPCRPSPPPCPPMPEPEREEAQALEWLPCDHLHVSEKCRVCQNAAACAAWQSHQAQQGEPKNG